MAQKWIYVYSCAAAVILMCLCIGCAGVEQSNVISKLSYYELVNVNDIDNDNITATYNNVRSAVICGTKCSGIAAKSFYFESTDWECHCNTVWMTNATLTVGQSNITYGKLMYEIVNESPSTTINKDCQEVYMLGIRTNGTYTVLLGNGTMDVFCDLSDGGWTIFQKRFDGSVDFRRNWTDYVYGFGDLHGEFWLGLETVHQMTKGDCELLIRLESNQTVQDSGFAKYTNFSIGNSSSCYTLNIGTFSADVYDGLQYHNGNEFTTVDMDNDEDPLNCASAYSFSDFTGWWYKNCWNVNLNGHYFPEVESCLGIIWDSCDSKARAEMKFKC